MIEMNKYMYIHEINSFLLVDIFERLLMCDIDSPSPPPSFSLSFLDVHIFDRKVRKKVRLHKNSTKKLQRRGLDIDPSESFS